MLSDRVYYFFTFVALTIDIWSILLSPRLVLQAGPDATGPQVARIVTESPLEAMLEAGVYAALALMNLRLPLLFFVAERRAAVLQILPLVPCSLNALVLYPRLMYKVYASNRLLVGSLWLLGPGDSYRTVVRVGVLCVMQFCTLSEIDMALHYTTQVRNRRPPRNPPAA